MGAISELSEFQKSGKNADVICQHSIDGAIIPIKIRLLDDDGEYQTYAIKSYKNISHTGTYDTPDGIPSTSHTWKFDCRIAVFGREKTIHLFYNAFDNYWRITF